MIDFDYFMSKVKLGIIDEVKISFMPEYLNKIDMNFDEPIHVACENGHEEVVKFLIDKGAKIESHRKFGWRPIFFACFNCHKDVLMILIKNRCEINALDQNKWQPIHWACRFGHWEIVKLLIKNRCDIEACGHDDLRPIHISCRYGHTNIVKLLIENNCNIEARDSSKWRPIHWACYVGNVEVARLLITNKCTLDMLTKNNKTPINIAEQYRYTDVMKVIQDELKRQLFDRISRAFQVSNDFNLDQDIYSKCSNDFAKGRCIGRGSFGKVILYKLLKSGHEFVVKSTYIETDDSRMIENNINRYIDLLNHERIVSYYGVVQKAKKFYILMEYMPQGSLLNCIEKTMSILRKQIINVSKQIIEGVEFLHGNQIIHRDITPSNILLDANFNIKLTDFGFSRVVKDTATQNCAKTFCGTINYLAPEIISDQQYSFPADIWSVGATIFHMLLGRELFHEKSICEIVTFILKNKKIDFKPLELSSRRMSTIVKEMLNYKPSNRPTAASLLKHELFLELDYSISSFK